MWLLPVYQIGGQLSEEASGVSLEKPCKVICYHLPLSTLFVLFSQISALSCSSPPPSVSLVPIFVIISQHNLLMGQSPPTYQGMLALQQPQRTTE